MQKGSVSGWIFDGSFSFSLDLFEWQPPTIIIHLDYPYGTVLRRLMWRTACRVASRERLWGTQNYECFTDQIRLWNPETSILAFQAAAFPTYRVQGKLERHSLGDSN